ncbi:hypothetical protein CRG98_001373 [Punica granatum]|uniref:Uncharacterized protein n=1 Tax=Punica granatum TaxID=22663 RepID=A0A2I0LC03_PUNGR|nr:hypothetical protein CRG98_001373 [Punica granatum]
MRNVLTGKKTEGNEWMHYRKASHGDGEGVGGVGVFFGVVLVPPPKQNLGGGGLKEEDDGGKKKHKEEKRKKKATVGQCLPSEITSDLEWGCCGAESGDHSPNLPFSRKKATLGRWLSGESTSDLNLLPPSFSRGHFGIVDAQSQPPSPHARSNDLWVG